MTSRARNNDPILDPKCNHPGPDAFFRKRTPMNANRLYKDDMIFFVRRLRRFSQIVLLLICG